MWQETADGLQELRAVSSRSSKKPGPLVIQPQGNEFSEKYEGASSLISLQMKNSLADTLTIAL